MFREGSWLVTRNTVVGSHDKDRLFAFYPDFMFFEESSRDVFDGFTDTFYGDAATFRGDIEVVGGLENAISGGVRGVVFWDLKDPADDIFAL